MCAEVTGVVTTVWCMHGVSVYWYGFVIMLVGCGFGCAVVVSSERGLLSTYTNRVFLSFLFFLTCTYCAEPTG